MEEAATSLPYAPPFVNLFVYSQTLGPDGCQVGLGQPSSTQSSRKLSLSSGARCSLRLSEAATSRQVRDISQGNNSNQFEADVRVVQPRLPSPPPRPSTSACLSSFAAHPNIPLVSLPPIHRDPRREQRPICGEYLSRPIWKAPYIYIYIYNRDHESRCHPGIIRICRMGSTVCVVNRFRDRNIG